ncbi:MAG: hypothetical protein K2N38_10165 [Oscillospiraceae bacterium]|nr:hypothetical protein [Oscillospiraceae bacterium]
MKKKTAMILLGVLSAVFAIVVGTPMIFLMAWLGDDWGAGAVVIAVSIFALLHAVCSTHAAKRYKRKYELSAPKYALLNVLPMLAIAVLLFAAAYLIGDWDGVFLALGAISLGGYTVGYAAVLSAVMGISYAVSRKRSTEWEKTTR